MRISTADLEGVLCVSKALKHQLLVDGQEMEDLFQALGNFSIYNVSGIAGSDFGCISHETFLQKYSQYVELLKSGSEPCDAEFRYFFSSIFTVDDASLYAVEVKPGRYLIKAISPVLQLQLHRFSFSALDEKFHPMVLGTGSRSWGIHFSYPQLFQDPKTLEFSNTRNCPNTALYKKLALWTRANTLPAPFLYQGRRLTAPIRLGKNCFSWHNLSLS